MNVALTLVAAQAICLLLGFARGAVAARRDVTLSVENALQRSRGPAAISILLLAAVVFLLVAQLHDPISQALPLLVQRWAAWATWTALATLFALLSGYALALAFARRHAERRKLAIAVALLNVGIAVPASMYVTPIAPRLGPGETKDGVVLQTTGSTCAAATLANIARRFDIDLDERAAAERLLTARYGTGRGPIRYALAELGIEFETLDPRQTRSLDQVTPPAMLFVDHPTVGSEGHAVAYMAKLGEAYEIWDPLQGKAVWDKATARRLWHGNGIACRRALTR